MIENTWRIFAKNVVNELEMDLYLFQGTGLPAGMVVAEAASVPAVAGVDAAISVEPPIVIEDAWSRAPSVRFVGAAGAGDRNMM